MWCQRSHQEHQLAAGDDVLQPGGGALAERRLGLPARQTAAYRRPVPRPVSWARIVLAVVAFYLALGAAVALLVR
jgi:hypothetical protein